ncbi:MAG: hypothetical protein LBN09_03460 [Clostridioides sp.]|jgi:hypothetical protein|nr:hypothetical protein [Clostridioides sp.]
MNDNSEKMIPFRQHNSKWKKADLTKNIKLGDSSKVVPFPKKTSLYTQKKKIKNKFNNKKHKKHLDYKSGNVSSYAPKSTFEVLSATVTYAFYGTLIILLLALLAQYLYM